MFFQLIFIFVVGVANVRSLVLGKATIDSELSDNFPYWFSTTENNPLASNWLHKQTTDDDRLYFSIPIDNYNPDETTTTTARFDGTPTPEENQEATKNVINKEEKLLIIKKMNTGKKNKKPKVKIFKIINKHCSAKQENTEVTSILPSVQDVAATTSTTESISKIETTTPADVTTPKTYISPPETTTTPLPSFEATTKSLHDQITTEKNPKIVLGNHLNNFLKEFTLKKPEKVVSTTESDMNTSLEWPFTSEEFEAKLKRYNGKSKSTKRAIGDTSNKNSILDNYPGMKKPKFIEKIENETSVERTERLNDSLQKLIQFITIAGQVDSYLTGRVRSVVSKLAAVYTDETNDIKQRNKRNLIN